MAPETAEEVQRLSEEDLRKFVDDFVSGRIYSSAHAPVTDPLGSFLILKIAPPFSESFALSVGLVYEYLSEAGPLAVNGNPTFLSARFLHVEDWERAIPAIQAEEERREGIAV